MIITSSISIFGCSNSIETKEDKVLDTIIVDEDTKSTTADNSELKIIMTAKTEGINVNGMASGFGIHCNGKIIYYTHSLENKEDTEVQFPKLTLDTLEIGKISDEKDSETGLNKINWEKKNESGRLLSPYMTYEIPRLLKDNKVYKFNTSGELEEITAYEPLVKKLGENLNRFEDSYLNGQIDLYWVGDTHSRAMGIVDTKENKYYEIDGEVLNVLTDRSISILGIENNKIYASLTDSSAPYKSTIGYFENNEFTTLISPNNEINIDIKGDIIYSNGKILFSGYVENKNGIWNYDIESEKLFNELEIEDETFFNFNINKQKDKIALSGHDYTNGSNKYTLNIGLINENLEIDNLSNVILTESKSKSKIKSFEGWSEDGKLFYLNSSLPDEENVISNSVNISYEVYEIID